MGAAAPAHHGAARAPPLVLKRKGGEGREARERPPGARARPAAGDPAAGAPARPGAKAESPGPRVALAGLLLILTAAAWLHAPALHSPFFADDYLFLDQARNQSLPAALASPDPLGNFFRPVGRQLWFWLLSRSSGESPLVFHAAALFAFLLTIALLFALAQRVAGARAGLIAAGIVAVHYAADVPIRWASGAQDLLAVAGAIAALLLHASGRTRLAGLALLAALLSKETVVFTPLVAVVLGRRAGGTWSRALARAWPLFAAVLGWALMWAFATSRVGGAAAVVERDPAGIPFALAHFAQALAGIEWPGTRMPAAGAIGVWGPLLLVAAVLAVALWRGGRGGAPQEGGGAIGGGIAWALLGALPVAAAASAWSAYYYLFAVCGAALALGAILARTRSAVAVAVVIALGAGTQVGRHLDEFATAERITNTQSRVNRFYLDRAMRFVGRYLDDLKRARPELPARSTLFFSGMPGFIGWQAADGPLVRWAYRDSSLRSYYLTSLTVERVRRGPTFFFYVLGDSLVEVPPETVSYQEIGIIQLLDGRERTARDAWMLHLEAKPGDHQVQYWVGMMDALDDDPAGARRLQAAGVTLRPGPAPEIEEALRMLAAGDTARAWQTALDGVGRHGADPGIHALLADIALTRPAWQPMGIFESWLVHRMAPEDRPSMRRWAGVLVSLNRFDRGADLFERYLAAGGEDDETNATVRNWLDAARRRMKGGDLAGESLRAGMKGN